ncbi:FAD-binding oxidoreductase [Candidatus Sumerlaeota bacterium]|nr:FAD-binding oxidoreductase [Candidatus Sumerlaeota bacterium]
MTKISGWGRYPVVNAATFSFETPGQLSEHLARPGAMIPFGMGRSYGDSALCEQIVCTRRARSIESFDPETGVVVCDAGVSLAELIDVFLPRGWFLSITPGTKYITVGGAIASDVHGKNHHSAGCFSACVDWFELMLPDGSVTRCSAKKNAELFRATCGGMGLTGVIVRAQVRLQPVPSAMIDQTIVKARNLEEAFELFEQYSSWTYSVAWIDCLAQGNHLGRSLLMVGEHAGNQPLRLLPNRKLNVPVDFPAFTLNSLSVSLFNSLYYAKTFGRMTQNQTAIDPFFYPLDAIHNWNRIYGKPGFTQYQFVLPRAASYDGLKQILTRIAASGQGSFLAVLKLFGAENDNYLSFPMEGYTLALDFKITPQLFPLLDTLDEMVHEIGGRVYLTKDARLRPDTFRQGYPGLEDFMKVRRQYGLPEKMQSLQSRRLNLQ